MVETSCGLILIEQKSILLTKNKLIGPFNPFSGSHEDNMYKHPQVKMS